MPNANKTVVQKEIAKLLAVLFQQHPVFEDPAYLGSALSQLRRTLVDYSRDVDTTASQASILPSWLETNIYLGPYERSMLYQLLSESDGDVVMIRGGSGSGKSSTFQHIENACGLASDHLKWDNPFGLRRFFVVIDLQSTSSEIDAQGLGRTADSDKQVTTAMASLMKGIAGAFDSFFTLNFSDATFRLLIRKTLELKPLRQRYTTLETAYANLHRKLESQNLEALRLADFLELFDSLPDSERVPARLLLLTQLARSLEEEGRAFIIVLDNIDPLPVLVQNKFVNLLAASVSSQLWAPLRLVVLARISTARHHHGVLEPVVIDHESVDPADMVIYRLTWFFLSPDAFPSFQSQTDDVKQAVIARLFELWRHLIDGRGPVRRLLSAMAGTNIRNAFKYATAWCVSEHFRPERYSKQILGEFEQNVRTLFGVQLITELDGALARIADTQLSQDEVDEMRLAIEIEPFDTVLDERGQQLAASMLMLLDDLYLLNDRPNRNADDIRRTACVIGRELLNETLLADGADRVTWLLHLALSNAVRRLKSTLPDEHAASSFARLVESFRARLTRELTVISTPDRPRVENLVNWIVKVVRKALSEPIDEASVERRMVLRDNIDTRTSSRLGRASFEPITSRFEAASVLIDPAGDDGPSALNAFTLDRRRVCPAILRLLYLLVAQGSATVRELYSDLLLHGFTRDDIYVALVRMAETDHRLIFAGLSDANDDLDPWLKSDKSVYLSAAGRGYYDDVVSSPPYLQWAFGEISEIRNEVEKRTHGQMSFLDRIDAALAGFKVIVAHELRTLERTWGGAASNQTLDAKMLHRSLSAEEVSCRSVSGDVFFRSYPAFIFSLLSHHKSLMRERNRNPLAIERLRIVAVQWHKAGSKWIAQHASYFGQKYEPWQIRLDIAASDLEQITRQ